METGMHPNPQQQEEAPALLGPASKTGIPCALGHPRKYLHPAAAERECSAKSTNPNVPNGNPHGQPPIPLSKYPLFYKTMDLLARRAPDDAILAASDKSRPFCQFLKLMDSVPIFQVEVLQEQTSRKIYIVL